MLVWAGVSAAGALAGAVNRWSPGVGGVVEAASLLLFLPTAIIAVVWVVRRGPRWPCLAPDRLTALLDGGEVPIAVAAVRIAGTQPWRPNLVFAVVGMGTVLGLVALSSVGLLLIFLPMALIVVPSWLLALAMSNRGAERRARSGPRPSTARSVPRSGGRPPGWLVLTDRRLALVEARRDGWAGLVWHVPRGQLERATSARRSLRTLDRSVRLHFADGSSVRMTAPDAPPFLAAAGRA